MVKEVSDITVQKVWDVLNQIPDPDIPVISIVELGIVRNVAVKDNNVEVIITPSYSGCPAMHVFKEDIITTLTNIGAKKVEISITHSLAWTTDWLSNNVKEKLKNYGIAPPEQNSETEVLFSNKKITCPFCSGTYTKRTSQFGSTPCKALWYCNNCQQPFEYFKCY
ncbi:MAG: phenylacetate-CoA oxygenase subunit PaaJ [Chitinophagaceae bacterium]|nr:phenylacetate-CoA oxygenase subunit PaaJ [Chitinophagaceae bacterium]